MSKLKISFVVFGTTVVPPLGWYENGTGASWIQVLVLSPKATAWVENKIKFILPPANRHCGITNATELPLGVKISLIIETLGQLLDLIGFIA